MFLVSVLCYVTSRSIPTCFASLSLALYRCIVHGNVPIDPSIVYILHTQYYTTVYVHTITQHIVHSPGMLGSSITCIFTQLCVQCMN